MPGGRRRGTIEIGGQIVTKKTRPWQVAGPMFQQMADETAKANARYIKIVCDDIAAVVDANGSKFRLRGARGNKVALEGKSDVKAFFTQGDRSFKVVGAVRGLPEGFWHIVEYGSGRHLIYSRRGKGGAVRTSQSGKVRKEFLTPSQVKRRFNTNRALNELAPIAPSSRAWAAQYAIHPGHGPIGKPWAMSMMQSEPLVARDLREIQGVALVRTFVRGG
jgi:hypothetical protein